mmetsp:Transcript_31975/g.31265  ORF Transcript_31975/g.31265 Transcript_31975/m.31265 type:complete len:173 (+) Transcript_31975:584-1102(+)|eukprot:CAMPEP_0170546028 /NCGR_PEP_ID=MMETSP0211-20121228/4407_1 /TAXON_ID=311385 /ORGANISM="Pseudokeronopsis sp., Strain OXSARD2" /LENGTH=172 /DNA_ID=CAMNT_0010850271 /DNA_START=575 /DNA_END=1093 /DNA_ORIENTATION=+
MEGISSNKGTLQELKGCLSHDLQPEIESNRDSVHKMRCQIKDNSTYILTLKQEVSERQKEKSSQWEKENRELKALHQQKERELGICHQNLDAERERELISLDMREDLEERMLAMNKESQILESNQKAMERQLEEFVKENESICNTLYRRDEEAGRMYEKNQNLLVKSTHELR